MYRTSRSTLRAGPWPHHPPSPSDSRACLSVFQPTLDLNFHNHPPPHAAAPIDHPWSPADSLRWPYNPRAMVAVGLDGTIEDEVRSQERLSLVHAVKTLLGYGSECRSLRPSRRSTTWLSRRLSTMFSIDTKVIGKDEAKGDLSAASCNRRWYQGCLKIPSILFLLTDDVRLSKDKYDADLTRPRPWCAPSMADTSRPVARPREDSTLEAYFR